MKHIFRIGVVGAGLACLLSASTAGAEPDRSGFTGDIGIGLAFTTLPTAGGNRETKVGLAPLSISLGGYLSPEVALLFRASGTSYFERRDQIGHNFYGIAAEVWPHDRLFIGGGIGVGVFGPNPFFSQSNVESTTGLALDFRVGTALVNGKNHDLTLSLEGIPGFYEDDVVMGTAVVVAWKWY